MAKIALCWELGKGNGHVTILAQLIRPLREQGHEVCLIVQNLCTANKIQEFEGLELYQAPILNFSKKSLDAVNYSSVLLMCGYDEPENLSAVVNAWSNLFKSLGIDFVIGEHSPTALVAANLINIPNAMVGFGFVVPRFEKPMPSMISWGKVSTERLESSDNAVLNSINKMYSIQGKDDRFESVQEVFSNSHKWLITVAELDHYGARNQEYLQRSVVLHQGGEPIWPDVDLEKVFVYFDVDSPFLPTLLKQLASVEYSVLMVVPNINQELIDEFSRSHLKIQRELVNIDKVAEQCKLVINHGAHQTILDFLKKAIPSIMLANTVERIMLSVTVGKQGLGFAATLDVNRVDVDAMLNTAARAEHIRLNAEKFALKYQEITSEKEFADLAASITEITSKQEKS